MDSSWRIGATWLLAALFLGAIAPRATAQETKEDPPTVESLAGNLEEMRLRMEEMDRRHEKETRALKEEIEQLRGVGEKDALDAELDRLLQQADEEILRASEEMDSVEGGGFISRALGLQALNPEISVAGDILFTYRDRKDQLSETDFRFRVLDLHVESYLDPYTQFKAALGVFQGKTVLGEGYFTRFGILPDLNVTVGKFRQQFGVVNRWHMHALDQIEFPMPLRMIFGEGGLNQTGISFEWKAPDLWGGSQQVIAQITEGENDRVFGENGRSLPCFLLRLKHFRDLNKDTWIEIGQTTLFGVNDRFQVNDVTERERRSTVVLGADVTVRWEPTEKMRYANLEWRTECYFLSKGILAPDGTGEDRIKAFGIYTSLQRKISRTVDVGLRLDWYRPDSKSYAETGGIVPLAYVGRRPNRWQVCAYMTWWQSPFVKVRFEVDYADGRRTGGSELIFALQFIFAAGPHKHERY